MSTDPPGLGPLRRPLSSFFSEFEWLVFGVLVTCAGLALFVGAGWGPRERGIRVFALLVACGLIVILRRWPLIMLAVAVALMGVAMSAGTLWLPFATLLGLASYYAASRLPRQMSLVAVGVAAAFLAGAVVYSTVVNIDPPWAVDAVEGFLPLIAAWFIGDSVAARRRYQSGLVEQAARERLDREVRAQLDVREERVRIARELHDVVAHTLAVITVQAGVGRRLMDKDPEEARNALDSIETIGRTAQEELRVVLGLLRDEEVRSASLVPAPRLLDLEELTDTVRESGIPVELHTTGADRNLSPALELSIFRVVQEALTNVVKHAPGASAIVDLAVRDDEVRIDVVNGVPSVPTAPVPAAVPGTGHGILGMRERVSAFGGSLVAEPLPQGGFHVLARVPIEAVV